MAGLILSGSQARVGMATKRSDYDVYIITDASITDANITDGGPAGAGIRSGDLDVAVIPLDEFGGYALPGHPQEWNRYSFAWASVLLDRRDGRSPGWPGRKGRCGHRRDDGSRPGHWTPT